MQVGVYALSAVLLIAAAFVVFRIVVRSDYRNRGRLSFVSSSLETAIFGLWAWFAYVNSPADWPRLHASATAQIIGWPLFAGGMTLTLVALCWLGVGRSFGRDVGILRDSGIYGLTRNPQSVCFALGILGYVVLWPSWEGAVSLLLVLAILHMMVLTEEEFLLAVLGDAYSLYVRRVPRYIGLRKRELGG